MDEIYADIMSAIGDMPVLPESSMLVCSSGALCFTEETEARLRKIEAQLLKIEARLAAGLPEQTDGQQTGMTGDGQTASWEEAVVLALREYTRD